MPYIRKQDAIASVYSSIDRHAFHLQYSLSTVHEKGFILINRAVPGTPFYSLSRSSNSLHLVTSKQ